MAELQRLKLRNVARRIWFLADNLKAALPDPSLPDRYESELVNLQKSLRSYGKTLMPGDPADLSTLSESLSGVLTGLFGKPADTKGLFLLEQNQGLSVVSSSAIHPIIKRIFETNRAKSTLLEGIYQTLFIRYRLRKISNASPYRTNEMSIATACSI